MIPPLIGFFGKLLVVTAAWDSGYLYLSLLAILVSVISAGFYLRVIRVLFFDGPIGRSESVTSFSEGEPSTSLRAKASAIPLALSSALPTLTLSSPLSSPGGLSAPEANPLISMVIATLTLIILLFLATPFATFNSLHLIALCFYFW